MFYVTIGTEALELLDNYYNEMRARIEDGEPFGFKSDNFPGEGTKVFTIKSYYGIKESEDFSNGGRHLE